MGQSTRTSRCLSSIALACAIVLTAAAEAEAGRKRSKKANAGSQFPKARIGTDIDSRDALVVRAAFRIAFQRVLQVPTCTALFTGLNKGGHTALMSTSYSSSRPGPERALCNRGVLAVARAGGSEIRLCPKLQTLSREGVAAILIHEALHTAGLGEYPVDPEAPTSEQITLAVLKACSLG